MLSSAAIASVHFLPQVTLEDLSRFTDCYETRVKKRSRAMFRVPEHRFFVLGRQMYVVAL
jgi:hypothetical protein